MVSTITVAGTAFAQYVPQPILYPFLEATDVPTTFAEAPMGVALPPISVPMDNDHARLDSGTPVVAARLSITGIIVAANGILSTNAEATADTQMIIATIAIVFPPLIFSIS